MRVAFQIQSDEDPDSATRPNGIPELLPNGMTIQQRHVTIVVMTHPVTDPTGLRTISTQTVEFGVLTAVEAPPAFVDADGLPLPSRPASYASVDFRLRGLDDSRPNLRPPDDTGPSTVVEPEASTEADPMTLVTVSGTHPDGRQWSQQVRVAGAADGSRSGPGRQPLLGRRRSSGRLRDQSGRAAVVAGDPPWVGLRNLLSVARLQDDANHLLDRMYRRAEATPDEIGTSATGPRRRPRALRTHRDEGGRGRRRPAGRTRGTCGQASVSSSAAAGGGASQGRDPEERGWMAFNSALLLISTPATSSLGMTAPHHHDPTGVHVEVLLEMVTLPRRHVGPLLSARG